MRLGSTTLVALGVGLGLIAAAAFNGWGQATASTGAAITNAAGPGRPGAALSSPDAQPPDSGPMTLHVTSRETIVDVTVTDAKGLPVHGLTQADFTIKEDGKTQPIRSFAEFGEVAPSEAHALPKLPAHVYTNLQPPPASSAVNVLLLDFVNTAPVLAIELKRGPQDLARSLATQRLVKQGAMKYLESMPPGTRVAVLGMTWPSSLRILQGFTSDAELLRAAVDTMDYATDAKANDYNSWCSQQDTRNRMTIESLDQIAADLAIVKGKKNLLWFTTGIPAVTNPNARAPCLPDYYKGITRSYGLLTAAQVAVSPIDARGLANLPDGFFSVSGQLHPDVPFEKGLGANLDFSQKTSEEQLSMDAIAEATGGTAYYNDNDLAGEIGKAIAKGANYYSLSYVPPSMKYDGRYHAIKVQLSQTDLRLVYRKGYAAEDPGKQAVPVGMSLGTSAPDASDGMRAAMSRSMPVSTQILFDVQVEPSTEPARPTDPPVMGELDAKLKGKTLVRYRFQYIFPARQIAFAEGGEGKRIGSLEFDVAVYDAQGKLVTSLSQTIKPPLTQAQYEQLMKGPMRFLQQVDLPVGQLFVRVGILDGVSKKAGTVEIPVLVGKK
jgi:VWFA-related protein